MTKLPDIYFLPVWGKLYQEYDQGEAYVFEFKNESGHVYHQFVKRVVPDKINGIVYYDIVSNNGFNGPIVLTVDSAKKDIFLAEYDTAFQQYCMDNNIVAEYVKFNPWLKNHLDFEKIYITKYNNYTLYTDLTVSDFFKEEFCSKIRNQIRKSIKNGVHIEFDFAGSSINEFNRLYKITIKKNNISKHFLFDISFLSKTFKILENNQFIINAIFEGKYISSAIFLNYGDYLHYHLCANDTQYYPLNANSLILYEACNWAQNNGKKQIHLGGAFSNELFAFKKQFTKNGICDYYVGTKIRNKVIYDDLVNLKLKNGKINNRSFFPLYRS